MNVAGFPGKTMTRMAPLLNVRALLCRRFFGRIVRLRADATTAAEAPTTGAKTVRKKSLRKSKDVASGISPKFASSFITKEDFDRVTIDRVLGIDVNTNSTGFVVLDGNGKLLDCGDIQTGDLENMYDKALFIRDAIVRIIKKHDIVSPPTSHYSHQSATPEVVPRAEPPTATSRWVVGIEEFLKHFGNGKFGTTVLFQLAQINSLVTYDCYRLFGSHPLKIHSSTARSFFAIKKPSARKVLTPPEAELPITATSSPAIPPLPAVVESDRKKPKWDVKRAVFDAVSPLMPGVDWRTTKTGKLKDCNFDITDAFIVAHTTLKKFKEEAVIRDEEKFLKFVEKCTANKLANHTEQDNKGAEGATQASKPTEGAKKKRKPRKDTLEAELREVYAQLVRKRADWLLSPPSVGIQEQHNAQ